MMIPLESNYEVGLEDILPDFLQASTTYDRDHEPPDQRLNHELDNPAYNPASMCSHGVWAAVQHEALWGRANCEYPA